MPPKKPPRQPKDPVTHRFQSILTRELVDKLCETHHAGDFRNATAARCTVHPKLLTRWLNLGRDNEDAGLATELYIRFCAIEGDLRAELIAEVRDTTASVTELEDGKPVSMTARRTSGVQWLLERRFRQYRADHVVALDEQDALAMLDPPAVALNLESAIAVCRSLAAAPERLPPEIRALFAATDWRAPKTLESHAEETSH